jgi:hypothetical protein
MPERHGRALVLLPSSLGRWAVVGIAVTNMARPIVPSMASTALH